MKSVQCPSCKTEVPVKGGVLTPHQTPSGTGKCPWSGVGVHHAETMLGLKKPVAAK